jgi:hypothetical protein
MAEITQLVVYPVKSCRGTPLRQVVLTDTGFDGDRNWMIVDGAGRFLTQREEPALARVEPRLESGFLEMRAPGMSSLRIPRRSDAAPTRVSLWETQCPALDEGEEAAVWISRYLGKRARLVRFDPSFKRPSSLRWTGGVAALNRFTDGYPILLVSEASIADLGARLGSSISFKRFRPNVVISGVERYEEDYLDTLAADGVTLKFVKPCTRCVTINTDQDTGEVGEEPLAMLGTYRQDARVDGAITFGQNLIIVHGVGCSLRLGQRLEESWTF